MTLHEGPAETPRNNTNRQPLDYTGLWIALSPWIIDNDYHFYSMSDRTDYQKELIYSFEEQLIQKMRTLKINEIIQIARELKFKTF